MNFFDTRIRPGAWCDTSTSVFAFLFKLSTARVVVPFSPLFSLISFIDFLAIEKVKVPLSCASASPPFFFFLFLLHSSSNFSNRAPHEVRLDEKLGDLHTDLKRERKKGRTQAYIYI